MNARCLIETLFLTTVVIGPVFGAPAPLLPRFPRSSVMLPVAIPATHHVAPLARHDTAQYTTVDAPDAGGGWGQGTFAWSMNSSAAVVGWFVDAAGKIHGFQRASDGTYTTVDVGNVGSAAYGINDGGAVDGGYVDRKTNLCPGFLRTPAGHFKKFDPPDDVGTWPNACAFDGPINKSSTVVGGYYASDGNYHSFLRTKDGTLTEFDPPGATGSSAYGINDGGVIAGEDDSNGGHHGYLRAADGSTLEFDPSGSNYTIAVPINKKGDVGGDFVDSSGAFHGYIRKANGNFVVYDAPDAGISSGQGTGGEGGLNNSGVVAATYFDSNSVPHGYIRAADGTITEFDVPGSIATYVWDINDNGVATGFYIDPYGTFHGFLRTP